MRVSFLGAAIGGVLLSLAAGSFGTAHAAEYEFKLHHFLPPVAPTQAKFLEPWAKKLAKESNGRIKIDIYPSMQLGGKPPQLIDQVRDDFADIVWTLPGYTPGRFVRTEVFELPFMHSTVRATNMALQDFLADHPEEWKDYHVLLLHVHAGQVFHSRMPIRTADDLKGLKIRTPNRIGGWMIEAMGATPVGAPVPQIPQMLSKGVVDAVLIPYEVALALKVPELVKYHTTLDDPKYPRINTSVFVLAMNKGRYDALPPDIKKVFDDNSGRHIAGWVAKIWDDAEIPGRKKSAELGELIKMPPPEVAKLRARVEKPVVDRWIKEVSAKGIDGAALVKEARALEAKYGQ